MSHVPYMISVLPEMFGAKKAKLQTKTKIEFAEFVRPDGYWPQPYSIEQTFQVYRWMVKTGKPFSLYQRYGVYDLLIGRGVMGTTDFYYEPIGSIESLRQVFHRAILARPNCHASVEWRNKHGIIFGKSRILHFLHYAPFIGTPFLGKTLSEAKIQALLRLYFDARGKLVEQLNPVHKKAVHIIRNVIRVYPDEFEFDLEYGYDGSSWWHHLGKGQDFIRVFEKAVVEFGRVSDQYLMQDLKL